VIRLQSLFQIALLAIASAVYATTAGANDRSEVLRARAERLIAQDDCDGAVPLLRRALEVDPSDASAGMLAGRCLVSLRRYDEAEQVLTDTRRRSPDLRGLELQLAIARYHRENIEGARQALDAARPTSAGDAAFELYDALVRLAEGDRVSALQAFGRARAADPRRVDPIASYYEGITWANEGDRRQARAALQRVADQDPNGPWGQEAQRHLEEMAGGWQNAWFASVTLGAEIDDNVVLGGEDVVIPAEIGDDDDERLIWRAVAGSEFYRTADWSMGLMLSYGGSAHRDLNEFDVHTPLGTLWIDRRITESLTAHLQYDGGHYLVDDDSFLVPHIVTPALYYAWGNGQHTRLFSRFYWYDYRFPRVDPDPVVEDVRNRSGHGIATGFEHSVGLDTLSSTIRGGLTFDRYSSRGGEYTHRRHTAHVSSETDLPWELILSLYGSYSYAPYSHATTFIDPSATSLEGKTRRDDVWVFQAALQRPITDHVLGSLRYRVVENDSNVDVFDYDRNIFGAYITVHFE
jgi:tetratricopeptide (TPR) repeat protein